MSKVEGIRYGIVVVNGIAYSGVLYDTTRNPREAAQLAHRAVRKGRAISTEVSRQVMDDWRRQELVVKNAPTTVPGVEREP